MKKFKLKIKNNYAIGFIIVVLLVSWVLTFVLSLSPELFIRNFSIVMFVPAIIAIIFSRKQNKSVRVIFKSIITKFNIPSILFAIGYPIAIIIICASISIATGSGKLNNSKLHDLFSIRGVITFIIVVGINCFTGSLGEELGWRGYLLPLLTERKGKLMATFIVSIVWALYHMPALFLLAKITGVGNPVLVAIIQGSVAFLANFTFSFCFYLSKSLIPVLILHTMWNYLNTKVLGDIYTNTQGIIEGNIFYINGEGVLGLIVIGITSLWFINQIKKDGQPRHDVLGG